MNALLVILRYALERIDPKDHVCVAGCTNLFFVPALQPLLGEHFEVSTFIACPNLLDYPAARTRRFNVPFQIDKCTPARPAHEW